MTAKEMLKEDSGWKDGPEEDKKKCDNHSDQDAELVTTDNNAHSEIALCKECKKSAGR